MPGKPLSVVFQTDTSDVVAALMRAIRTIEEFFEHRTLVTHFRMLDDDSD